jgi:hypothetical protein
MNTVDTRPPGEDGRKAALVHILQRVWTYAVLTKSDDARAFADEIAEASSRGLLTTQVIPSGTVYGRIWKVTPSGVKFLFANANLLTGEEVRYAEHYSTR